MDILRNIYEIYLLNHSVTTDTRSLKEGDIFIALKGDNFNGNKYAQQAINLGASAVVVDEDPGFTHHRLFMVDQGLAFLQQLANHHRRNLSIPFIGITGSNGKTTTKELIHAVLSSQLKTHATKGNYNNHIGVPLTLLQIRPETQVAIIEMGANHLEEIKFLCQIAEPTHGYITNFGKAHLEGFGSEENIVKGKSELYDFLKLNSGIALVDFEDPKQMSITQKISRITFGNDSSADIFISDHSQSEDLELGFEGEIIYPKIHGTYNIKNVSAAIALGSHFKIRTRNIKKSIEQYEPKMNRSQLLETDKNQIILDAYNANPSSMILSISSFLNLKTSYQKVLILGDMFELGHASKKEHQAIVDFLVDKRLENVLLIGSNFNKTKSPKTWNKFKTTIDAKSWIEKNLYRNSQILIKGSRGMKLEGLTEIL